MRLSPLPLAVLALCAATACSKKDSASADGGGASSGGGALGSGLEFLNGFEGEIDAFMKDSSKGGQQVPIAAELKAGKARFAIPEGLAPKGAGPSMMGDKGYVIFDGAAKKLSIVDDAQKQAIVIDLNSANAKSLPGLGGAPGPHPGGAPSGPPQKVTKTGKTDTVAGYKCEYWDVASDHKEASICVADQGASWLSIPMTGIPTEKAWMLELMDGKHFPLRFIGYGKDGTTEESRLEVTKIDKKSLADSEFQVPAGYKVIDLEKMFQGLGGMPVPPHPLPGPRPR